MSGLLGFTVLAVVAGGAAVDNDGGDCWADDFNWELCCAERWGLTGNSVCWNNEFTYLRCCGLDAFPQRAEDDAAWDALRLSEQTPTSEGEFDFIIVGAGSAGSVLAARLAAAEGPDGRPWRVLLLEDGPEVDHAAEPADPDNLPEGPARWHEALQASWKVGGEQRVWSYKTGRGVGGSSGINSMIYMRGCIAEYEAFGWSRDEVLDAFRALEAPMEVPGFVADPVYHRPFGGQHDGEGYHTTLVSALPEELPPVFQALLAAFDSAGVPPRLDPHAGLSMHGVGGVWRTMGCGHARCQPSRVPRMRYAVGRPRSSPAVALLAPLRRRQRQRLVVQTGAKVERVVFGDADGRRAVGVEVLLASGTAGMPQRRVLYRAAKEVVVAAGVFSSPKLLTLSGVGEPRELDRLGVPLVASAPEVGRNLHEHVGLSLVFGTTVACPEGYHVVGDNATSHLGNTHEFIGQLYAFFNSTKDEPGALGPLDVEVMLLEGCFEGFLSLTFTIILLQTFSRGRIVVQSRNPGTAVHLDYKPLSHSSDIDLLINAIRRLYTKVFSSPEMEPFALTVSPSWDTVADVGRLAQWVRSSLWYYSHPGGTCRVHLGPEEPGVVDSDFKVIGTEGLRVADASVLPRSATGHTDGPSRLIGELAARALLRHWMQDEAIDAEDGGAASFGGIPTLALRGYPGVRLPMCGFGTNGFEGERAVSSVSHFLRLGGRLLDTGLLYNNHGDIAIALRASGVRRDEAFVVSKIPPGDMGSGRAASAIDRIMAEIGTHVDLLLIHWPSNFDPAAELPPCAQPPGSWKRCRLETWRAMEAAQRAGKVRALGVSNFGVRHLTELLDDPDRSLPVAVDEVEFHPWWPQAALVELARQRHVRLVAYGSTGGSLMGGAMLHTPAVSRSAASVGRSPAQVLLRWAVQQGVVVIPSSSSEAHVAENMDIFSWSLPEEDMRLIGSVSKREHMRVYLPDPEDAP